MTMKVYFEKQRKNTTGDVTATHGTVMQVVGRYRMSHKLYMEN
jgi:hypothetical protein